MFSVIIMDLFDVLLLEFRCAPMVNCAESVDVWNTGVLATLSCYCKEANRSPQVLIKLVRVTLCLPYFVCFWLSLHSLIVKHLILFLQDGRI